MSTSSKPKTTDHSSASTSYHHGNLREALIEAGLELLEAGPTADFSLRELARHVGVSANATYRHFASKEALMAALAGEGFRRMAEAQANAMSAVKEPGQAFRAAGLTYVSFARTHPALFRLMFGRFSAEHVSPEMHDAGRLLVEGVTAALGLAADDPRAIFAAIHAWSLVHGLSHLILDGQLDALVPDLDTLAERVLQPDVSLGSKPHKSK